MQYFGPGSLAVSQPMSRQGAGQDRFNSQRQFGYIHPVLAGRRVQLCKHKLICARWSPTQCLKPSIYQSGQNLCVLRKYLTMYWNKWLLIYSVDYFLQLLLGLVKSHKNTNLYKKKIRSLSSINRATLVNRQNSHPGIAELIPVFVLLGHNLYLIVAVMQAVWRCSFALIFPINSFKRNV